jgi:hypothetical protein
MLVFVVPLRIRRGLRCFETFYVSGIPEYRDSRETAAGAARGMVLECTPKGREESQVVKEAGKGMKRLEAGQKVRDAQDDSVGVVLDFACQYAHPKAQPVYSYLIRWPDGQIRAYTEAAFFGDERFELVD